MAPLGFLTSTTFVCTFVENDGPLKMRWIAVAVAVCARARARPDAARAEYVRARKDGGWDAPIEAAYRGLTGVPFASLGAGRVLWPVIAAILRVMVVLGGGLILLETEGAGPADFFWLIAAGMATQAMVTGVAIRLGAWTRGLDKESDSEE